MTSVLVEPEETDPDAVLARFAAALGSAVEAAGPTEVAAETGLTGAEVEAIRSGDVGDIDLDDAAAVLALGEGEPPAAEARSAVREHLLLGMSTAMLSVDRLAAALEGVVEPREVQGMVEGRYPMTLAEYAHLRHAIEAST